MAITIQKQHLETLIDVSDLIIKYKSHALSARAWSEFSTNWLNKLLEQFAANEFLYNNRNKNTAVWLIDQICHSRLVEENCPLNQGIPLCDTELGQRSMAILRAMSQGQAFYDNWAEQSHFRDLFV